ncbi:LRR receptor-like serine/threonine-protein kinase RKF3 [Pyrus ussuriensis x Pyrus communis]|uniref:LRR receptor-like serine/threonine-protein kinase RKF3 n=1 Tax=Pyrus ussuriensis x Pyrus communis TaxID=2448454 RepID=A0A5N5HAQ6_9ROSA|nr:LRR receptor-like serine/threonine-protein kinase RKF3 [Pyrus ussuriensis x Pyrus communis]
MTLQSLLLTGESVGNVSTCAAYPSWCGVVISLERGRNADEAKSSQREDAKRHKGDEAGLSSPVVFGGFR